MYAAELAGYVANLKQFANIPLYAISIQNEPDVSTTYPSCLWTGQQYHDFATNLFNALMASNVASTKILLPEGSSWNSDYSSTAMSDPTVAAEVGIIAEHNYDGPNFNTGSTASPAALPSYGKSLWETEVSTGRLRWWDYQCDLLGYADSSFYDGGSSQCLALLAAD